jgi:hypothetical protein
MGGQMFTMKSEVVCWSSVLKVLTTKFVKDGTSQFQNFM